MASSTPTPELHPPAVRGVSISRARSELTFTLEDGRSVTVPLDWYPRLKAGTDRERRNWSLIGAGSGVHWPDLDEDISVEGLLLGRRSMEGEPSFRSWLDQRTASRRRGSTSPK